MVEIPQVYREIVAEERAALWELARRAGELAAAGDRDALTALADEVRARIESGEEIPRSGGHLRGNIADVVTALDAAFDRAFPVLDRRDAAGLLDVPWPTRSRAERLAMLVGERWFRPEPLVDAAIERGDARLLHLLLLGRFGAPRPPAVARALDALQALGELDESTVERTFAAYPHLWKALEDAQAACRPFVRDVADELFWRGATPKHLRPRGLRFVRRAIVGNPPHADVLGTADLTDAERAELVEWLATRPPTDVERAFELRSLAGDADALLPVRGLTQGLKLYLLCRDGTEPYDLAEIQAAAAEAGEQDTTRILGLCPSEAVEAALGRNRGAVEKRVRHNALEGIAAYGLLPLEPGETALSRYTFLREVAKRGPKLGPNRRHSHAAAVDLALVHLAQVAGFPDAARLEWHCEAEIAQTPAVLHHGDYTATVHADGTDAAIEVDRAGKRLRSVPQEIRKHPGYPALREHQDRLRDQARRMRTGLLERLVATAGTVTPDELERLRRLPAGAAMLPSLLWLDAAGTIGLLSDVDTGHPLTAVHPWHLYERGTLSHWQSQIVASRVKQPVRQAFRELYLLTPAERETRDHSTRFANHRVNGKVAGQLLSARGWRVGHEHDEHPATRPVPGGLTAALRCEFHGYFGLDDVVLGELSMLDGATAVPLESVDPVAFSEVMRDLDLVVSVAGTDPDAYASPLAAQSRAQLLAALIRDLNLTRVTIEGTTAVVRGSRATYQVHLNSGSIHLDPAGHLCVVPAAFGTKPHTRLFLPFADEDPMTSVVLSKILLLSEDESITDESILSQLPRVPQ
ncbi:DUF4132 domain-containing protein [Dactylosporangium sp. CA-233914]|uniref:DUF4132 domain-containing protein n=1 Tax=Dactylosporangium sp. CA-233914 TaxID=3239934 RepID=UPI003D9307B4